MKAQPPDHRQLERAKSPGPEGRPAGHRLDPNRFIPETALGDAERRIVRRMNKHPYREALERVFLRYTRALDSADFESVFLKLWSLMEHLTDAAGQNYDDVVKRALFLFSDRKLTRQLLEHLRDQRNAIVHDEGTDTDVERLAFQAKRIVEALMRFHLNTGRHYESIAEAATILSQPCSPGCAHQAVARCDSILGGCDDNRIRLMFQDRKPHAQPPRYARPGGAPALAGVRQEHRTPAGGWVTGWAPRSPTDGWSRSGPGPPNPRGEPRGCS